MNSEESVLPNEVKPEPTTNRKSASESLLAEAGVSEIEALKTQILFLKKITFELEQRDLPKTATEKLLARWFEFKERIERTARIIAERETPQLYDGFDASFFQGGVETLLNHDWLETI